MHRKDSDELLTDKVQSLFGKTTNMKLQRMKIMIIGLESVGMELALHLTPLQPDTITLIDQNLVQIEDLDVNCTFRQQHVDKKSRAEAGIEYLNEQFNVATNLRSMEYNINDYLNQLQMEGKQELPEGLCEEIDKHDLIIVCDILCQTFVIEIDKRIRANNQKNKKINQGLIWSVTIGLFAFYFQDYGTNFKIYDKDGQQPFPYHIEHITNSDPGVVKVIKEKQLTFQTGDFVCIHEAEGMTEVNGNEPRPIRIISPFEFQIEDTTHFQSYTKGGLVQLQKVPQKVSFQSIEEQLKLPLIDKLYGSQHLTALSTIFTLIQGIETNQKVSDDDIIQRSKERFQKMALDLEQLQAQDLEMLSQNSNILTIDFNNEKKPKVQYEFCPLLCYHILTNIHCKLFPMVTLWGGVISMEAIKFTGKFQPQQHLALNFYDYFEQISNKKCTVQSKNAQQKFMFGKEFQDKLSKLNIIVGGLGGNGCEFVRNLSMMGCCVDPDSKMYLVDDQIIRNFNVSSHYWFNQDCVGQKKAEIAQKKAWNINQNLNIELLLNKVGSKQEQNQLHDLKNYLIVSSSNNQLARSYLYQKAVNDQVPYFDQMINNLKGYTQFYIPDRKNIDDKETNWQKVFNFSKETFEMFPYMPMHSLVWAKQIFDQCFVEFIQDYENYFKNPSQFIEQIPNTPGNMIKLLILSKLVEDSFEFTIDNIVYLGKELFEYFFEYKIKSFLAQYPPDLQVDGQPFWSGYRRCPEPIAFNPEEEMHVQFILKIVLIFSQIFHIENLDQVGEKILEVKNEKYWNLVRMHLFNTEEHINKVKEQLKSLSLPNRLKISHLNLEEENVRVLYIHTIYYLTNLRSSNYFIKQMPKQIGQLLIYSYRYKVQKYSLEINRSYTMIHSILVGQSCIQLYQAFFEKGKIVSLHVDLNRNLLKIKE